MVDRDRTLFLQALLLLEEDGEQQIRLMEETVDLVAAAAEKAFLVERERQAKDFLAALGGRLLLVWAAVAVALQKQAHQQHQLAELLRLAETVVMV
jgi:hypothetical protein